MRESYQQLYEPAGCFESMKNKVRPPDGTNALSNLFHISSLIGKV